MSSTFRCDIDRTGGKKKKRERREWANFFSFPFSLITSPREVPNCNAVDFLDKDVFCLLLKTSFATVVKVNRLPVLASAMLRHCVAQAGETVDLMGIHENVTRRTTLSWPSDRPSIHKKKSQLRVTIQSGVPHLAAPIRDTHKEMRSVS